MGSLRGTEVYYQKFIELQEKLRKSEEDRLKLEMKFNEMVQCTREEEQAHYRKLRQQYKRFLEEDRRRQERNEAILRALDRVEGRASVLAAKTERYKCLRKQYQKFMERLQNASQTDAVAKTGASEQLGLFHRHSSEEPPRGFKEDAIDSCYYKSVENVPKDVRNEIIQKYLQSLKPIEPKVSTVRKNNQRYPFTISSNNTGYSAEHNGLSNLTEGNKTSSIVDEIMESIYSKQTGFGGGSSKDSFLKDNDNKFLSNRNFGDENPQCFARSGDQEFNPRHQLLERFDQSYSHENVVHGANNRSVEEVKELLPSHHVMFLTGYQKERTTSELAPLSNVFKNYSQENNEIIRQTCNKTEGRSDTFNEIGFQNGQQEAVSKNEGNKGIKFIKMSDDNEVDIITKEEPPQELHEALLENVNVCKAEEISESEVYQEPQQSDNNCQKEECIQSEKTSKTTEEQESLQAEGGELLLQSEVKSSEDYPSSVKIHTDAFDELTAQENRLTGIENIEHKQELKNQEISQEHNESVQQLSEHYEFESNKPLQDDQSGQPLQYRNGNDQAVHQHKIESQPVQDCDVKSQYFQQAEEDSQLLSKHDNLDNQTLEQNEKTTPLTEQSYESGESQKQQYYDENGQYYQQYDESGQPVPQYYDENGQPVQYDKNGQQVHYDKNGQQVHYDESGQSVQYDENGQPVQYDKNGQSVQYDENGQPLQYDENGQRIQYDENGQPVHYDKNGQEVQCDENGQPLQYDENGQPVQYDQNGQRVQYDESGQPLQYDENGQPLQYDENGQSYNQYGVYGQQNQVMYDENGEPIQQYDEYGQPVQYEQQYDENGQLIQQSYDENNQQYYGYDANAQLSEHYQQDYAVEPAQCLDKDTVNTDTADKQHELEKQEEYPDKDVDTVEKPTLSETENMLKEGNGDKVELEQPVTEQDQGVADEKKPHKVMEMLDTDTENSRQDTKESHDSDFDFSASQK